ncbi:basic-leucine zipper transcription factor f-related [Anaeramoeba flamelloides]|uniref:Basic-leucine zipper transcription factor f-related n=1 Tax=Anaeramoeba flamelloides TaxID=1746091 RepID=A0AAV8A7T9_9EUKA|nr:basic-leucine zipper transcription factor f-related [Anaeramoeba flamelloides]
MDLTLLNYSDLDQNLLETSFLDGKHSEELFYDSLLFDDYKIQDTEDLSTIDQLKPTQEPKLQLKLQSPQQTQLQKPLDQQHNVNLELNLNYTLNSDKLTTQDPIQKSQKLQYNPNTIPQIKSEPKQNPYQKISPLPKIEVTNEIPITQKTGTYRSKQSKKPKKTNESIQTKKKHGRALDDGALKIRQRLAKIEDPEMIKNLTQEEKRLRRLERNRLSAKRTRMRKKNEEKDSGGQISKLQKIVQQLKNQLNQQTSEIRRLNSVIEYYKSKEEEEQQQQEEERLQQQYQKFEQKQELVQRKKQPFGVYSQPLFTIGSSIEITDLENGFFENQTQDSANLLQRKRTREIKKQPNQKLFKTNKKALFTTLFAFCIIVGLCYNFGTSGSGGNELSSQPPSLNRIDRESIGEISWHKKNSNGNGINNNNQQTVEKNEKENPSDQQSNDQNTKIEVDLQSNLESDFDSNFDTKNSSETFNNMIK